LGGGFSAFQKKACTLKTDEKDNLTRAVLILFQNKSFAQVIADPKKSCTTFKGQQQIAHPPTLKM